MSLSDPQPSAFWAPICKIVCSRRCWLRVAATEPHGGTSDWGMGLGLPTPTYLEGPGGPVPIDQVKWIELATERIRGGMAGRPLETIDAEEELVAALGETPALWSLYETTWSVTGIFDGRRGRVIHIANPFAKRKRS